MGDLIYKSRITISVSTVSDLPPQAVREIEQVAIDAREAYAQQIEAYLEDRLGNIDPGVVVVTT